MKQLSNAVFEQVLAALRAAQVEAIILQSRLNPGFSKNQKAIAALCGEAVEALEALVGPAEKTYTDLDKLNHDLNHQTEKHSLCAYCNPKKPT